MGQDGEEGCGMVRRGRAGWSGGEVEGGTGWW